MPPVPLADAGPALNVGVALEGKQNKMILNLSRLAAISITFGGLALALPVSIVSDGGDASQTNNSCLAATGVNNGNCDTTNITKHPEWATPLPGSHWVSYGATGSGAGYFDVTNSRDVEFYHPFALPGDWDQAQGSISVMADDTAQVWLNGVLLYDWVTPNTYPKCASQGIGCLDSTRKTIQLASDKFNYGAGNANLFKFVVGQRGGSAFGLSYAGSIDGSANPAEVPEPATNLLIGAGLAGLYFARKK